MWIRAEVQAMADNEVAGMVDKAWLDGIRASDPHPTIKAFVIGHEGDSDILLGGVPTPVSWMRKAVGWIHDKLSLYTPLFQGHGAPGDNSQDGRVPVGYIVGKKLAEVGNKVATVAAMYIFPSYKGLSFDVASIEANIGYTQDDGTVRPSFIESVTAVALGNSAVAKPGFPGATLVGAFQAFADNGKDNKMTNEELKNAVKTAGLRPAELFTLSDLENDPGTKRFVDEAKHDVYNQNVRLQTELNELRGRTAKDAEVHAAEVKRLKTEAVLAKFQPTLSAVIAERKLPEKQAAFVNLRLRQFKGSAEDEAGLKAEVNRAIEEAQAEYVDFLKSQGIDPTTILGKPEGEGKPGEKPGVSSGKLLVGDDEDASVEGPFGKYSTPATNPLLAP